MSKVKVLHLILGAMFIVGSIIALRMATVYPFPVSYFGYDFGFYSYAVTHTHLSSLTYLLGFADNFGGYVFVVLNWLRLPQIESLIVSFYLFQALGGLVLFFILRKSNLLAGVLAAILFAFSIPQTQLHVMFLWKAVLGQLLLLLVIFFVSKKYLKLTLLTALLTFISHRTTSIALGLTLVPFLLADWLQTKRSINLLLLAGVVLAGAIVYSQTTSQNLGNIFLNPTNFDVAQGIFLNIKEYLLFAITIIPFAIIGMAKQAKKNDNNLWGWLLLVSLSWIILGLPFHNRFIQYLDLALIFFASSGIAKIKSKQIQIIAVAVVTIGSILSWYDFKQQLAPNFSKEQLTEIKQFSEANQGGFVLATSAADAPWLLAHVNGNVRLAAPGLFEDNHSFDSWQSFWSGNNQTEFLRAYPVPLYIYQHNESFPEETKACLQQQSKSFYKFICQN